MLDPLRGDRQRAILAVGPLKKSVIGAAVALIIGVTGLGAVSAPPLPDFTVDLNPASHKIKKHDLLVADKLTGNYNEVLTVTGANTFAVEGYWDVGQLVHDDGTIPYTAGDSRLGVNYGLYALFSYTGTFAANSSGGFDFFATAGSITLYFDPNLRTGKILPNAAPNAITRTDFDDDSELATATLSAGAGHFQPGGLAPGDFALRFNSLALRGLGPRYFIDPAPFYSNVVLHGQFNSFAAASNQQVNGSADATMEP